MNPTGSISGRNWRTRWGTRLRVLGVCAVAALALFTAARAHADWPTAPSLPGKPTEVLDVWSPGVFSVGFVDSSDSTGGAYLFMDGRAPRPISGLNVSAAGTYYDQPHDCFVMLHQDNPGGRRSSDSDGGTCVGGSIPGIGGNYVYQVKHAREGGGALLVTDEFSPLYRSDGSIYGASFMNLSFNNSINPYVAPGVLRVGSTVNALVATSLSSSRVYWLLGNDAPDELTPSAGAGPILTVDTFAAGSPPMPYAVVGAEQGFLQGSIRLSPEPLRRVQLLDAGQQVNSVAMNVEQGGPAGYGFGMAVVLDGTSASVMSAVPKLSNTQAGTEWRPRPMLAPGMAMARLRQVACAGASYCVFTADKANGDNLFIYVNSEGPSLDVSATSGAQVDGGVVDGSVLIDEGRTVTVSFTPSDKDGDPVLVTGKSALTDGGVHLISPFRKVGDGVAVDVQAELLCRDQCGGALHVRASDGLQRHELSSDLSLCVVHTRDPGLPVVQRGDGSTVPPGGPPLPLDTDAGTLMLKAVDGMSGSDCPLVKTWVDTTPPGSGGPTFTQDSGTAWITPPTDYCKSVGSDFTYRLDVQDEGKRTASGQFTVHLDSTLIPISSGHLWITPATGSSPAQAVNVSSDLNCARERSLKADLQLRQGSAAGPVLKKETLDLDMTATWPLPDGLGCGDYTVTGTLRQRDEMTSPEQSIFLAGKSAGLAPLPDQPLVAHCGEGVRATLDAATFPGDSCQTPELSWTPKSGPALAQTTPLVGNSPLLATQDTGLDSLVGQSIVLTVTADSHSGIPATRELTLPITVEPFVKVIHRTEVPAASETGFVGIFADLKNTTACGVTDVHYDEQPEGFTYVEGSAHFDGQPVDVLWDGSTLSVSGLSLEGGTTKTLTYLARPHLLGQRHLRGEASLNKVPISQSEALEPTVPDSGCGCTSTAGSTPVFLALGALLAAVRRRRA